MNFDKLIILKCLDGPSDYRELSFGELSRKGVSAETFSVEPEYYKFVFEHKRKHSAFPTRETFEKRFSLEEATVNEPLSFYIEEIKKARSYKVIAKAMDEADDFFVKNGLYRGIEILEKAIKDVKKSNNLIADLIIKDTVDERWERYSNRIKNPGLDGISTGFPRLDSALYGWHGGEFNLLTARLGSYKTWTLLMMAVGAMRNSGARCLIGTVEMGVWQIARRLDSWATGTRFENIRSGIFPNEAEISDFKDKLFSVSADMDCIIIGGAGFNAGQLEAKIEEYSPTIVWVDGLYLMYDESGAKQHWEQMKNISRDLKRIAQERNIPINATTQLVGKGKGSSGKEEAEDIMYAKALAQNADNVITLGRIYDSHLEEYTNKIWIKTAKLREGEPIKFKVEYNLDTMEINELGDVKDSRTKPEDLIKGNKIAPYDPEVVTPEQEGDEVEADEQELKNKAKEWDSFNEDDLPF